MNRLFYFTGYRLTVMHWKGKELLGSSSFEPTEDGLYNFREYLEKSENIPGKFLVDVIEEDFRNETVPHVGSKDRNAIISRLIDRYYRSSQEYCYSEVIGRQKSGRKDDIVLLGAMTNPQLIQPWLSIMDECKTLLSGIWTLPLISKKILKTIKANTGVVLLVSQQVNSNVRQTLFRDGKLISSRQSIINQDMGDISNIGEHALPEVNRTIQFLRAQNHIAADEIIRLHILGSEQQLDSLKKHFKADERQTINIHAISDVQEKLGLKGVGKDFSDNIFAWLCMSQGVALSHYGEARIFTRYRSMLAATALYAASLLVIISGVLITEANISDSFEYEKSISMLQKEKNHYRDLYQNKFKDFEEVFQNAGVMNAAVELAEQIKINSATSPLDFLIGLSETLSNDEENTLHIDKIEWRAVNIDDENNKIKSANFTDNKPVKHDAIVTGRIDDPEHNYRDSINHIQKIIGYLDADPRVERVEALRLPVDLRSDSKFSTESGVDAKSRAGKETTGVFTLRITMKAPDHV